MFAQNKVENTISYEDAHLCSAVHMEPTFGAKFCASEQKQLANNSTFGSSVQKRIDSTCFNDPVLSKSLEMEVACAYNCCNPLRMKNGYPSSLDTIHGNKFSVMYDYSRSRFPACEVIEGVNDYRTVLENRAFHK